MRRPHRMLLKAGQEVTNRLLGRVGLEIVRTPRPFQDYRAYIPWRETLDEARKAGMSVGDYIDATHNVAGTTQATIDRMVELRAFDAVRSVCEIGPGSGRYLQKVIEQCRPESYEIYETAKDWARWLVETYRVGLQPTDGWSLSATPAGSIDLVHAHKVFPGLPTLVTCRYVAEMARVVRPGGKVAFDVVTEECLDQPTLDAWLSQPGAYEHYPCLMPRAFVIEILGAHGCTLDGSFRVPMKPGTTEYLVFTKKTGAAAKGG